MENDDRTVQCCCFNLTQSKFERFQTCIWFFLVSTAAYLLKTIAPAALLSPSQPLSCSDSCIKHISVYRLSFACVVYHSCSMLFLKCYEAFSDHDDSLAEKFRWWMKPAFLFILCLGFFFIPASFFYPYPMIALIFSIVYLFFQMFILVNFAHELTETCLEKYEETESIYWKLLLFASTFLLFTLMLTLMVVMYFFYNHCWIHMVVVSFLFLCNLFQVVLSIHPKVQQRLPTSGLLQASMVALYSTYILSSGIYAFPSLCNPLPPSPSPSLSSSFSSNIESPSISPTTGFTQSIRVISIGISLFALTYSALDTAKTIATQHTSTSSVFHFVFMLASFHMAIAFTDWNATLMLKDSSEFMKAPNLPFWSKVAVSIGVVFLYIWTLVAPIILKNRDFS